MQRRKDAKGRVRIRGLAHERLGIVSPEAGAQPLFDESGAIALSVNGEIYNHRALRAGTDKLTTDPYSIKCSRS